jgi:ribonuclease P/MRP protein subunit RPP40
VQSTLTYNSISEDNTLPATKWRINLTQDKETGLQGCPAQYSGRKILKFIVSIDLVDLSFKPDSKKCERTFCSIKEKKPLKFDFLLASLLTVISHIDVLL